MSTPRRPKLRQILATNVRRERTGRDWSQEELADRAGISQTYTSQLESAQRAVSIDTIEKIARAFNLEPDQLLRRQADDGHPS
jgi:transcriptional regulator with XRE-family HTH domain